MKYEMTLRSNYGIIARLLFAYDNLQTNKLFCFIFVNFFSHQVRTFTVLNRLFFIKSSHFILPLARSFVSFFFFGGGGGGIGGTF